MSYIRTQNASDESSAEIEKTEDGVLVVAGWRAGEEKLSIGSRSKSHILVYNNIIPLHNIIIIIIWLIFLYFEFFFFEFFLNGDRCTKFFNKKKITLRRLFFENH